MRIVFFIKISESEEFDLQLVPKLNFTSIEIQTARTCSVSGKGSITSDFTHSLYSKTLIRFNFQTTPRSRVESAVQTATGVDACSVGIRIKIIRFRLFQSVLIAHT